MAASSLAVIALHLPNSSLSTESRISSVFRVQEFSALASMLSQQFRFVSTAAVYGERGILNMQHALQ